MSALIWIALFVVLLIAAWLLGRPHDDFVSGPPRRPRRR